MMMIDIQPHGYVKLLRIAGPWHDNDITDVAHVARVSFDATEAYSNEKALKLVDYLWAHRHTTPFEMIQTWWEIKLPIFVARQLVRHRTASINEVSRRYVTDQIEFYLPEVWRKAADNKKQGSIDEGFTMNEADCLLSRNKFYTLRMYLHYVHALYNDLIANGVCPEQARMLLPLNLYTRMIWRQDLHNLLHMISLRIDPHAQAETREYAQAMLIVLAEHIPVHKFVSS